MRWARPRWDVRRLLETDVRAIRPPRLTTRRMLAAVAVVAALIGVSRERERRASFRESARRYAAHERELLKEGEVLRRSGRPGGAEECARKARAYGTLARWYSSHVDSGGHPPLAQVLDGGFPIEVAFERSHEVVAGEVVRLGWTSPAICLRVSQVYKGALAESDVIWVSLGASHSPLTERLRRGDRCLVFFCHSPRAENLAMKVLDRTEENLEAIRLASARERGR
jgi:hypothetical protein